MANKHNASQANIDLRALNVAAPKAEGNESGAVVADEAQAPKAQRPPANKSVTKQQPQPVESRPVSGPAEAIRLLLEELIRLVRMTLEGKLLDGKLLSFLQNHYLKEFERLGAVDAVATYGRLAKAIQTATGGQCANIARQILDPSFVPASVEGKLFGKPIAIAGLNGLRTVHQQIDCGSFGVVEAKLIGESGGYVDDFGFQYTVAKQ